ncbi:MAG: SPFH domain-containing protein [Gracilibacteraceae bacterium]|jgi:regulator of protease activity HflC (stomatin/prohibitin superfamily)|nr:SPFH domain-containing protein [Gracilibacteraceae bacterium]
MTNEKIKLTEKEPFIISGMLVLLLNLVLTLAAIAACIIGIVICEKYGEADPLGVTLILAGGLYGFLLTILPFMGLKIVKPNEALVMTLFGRYFGTIKREGFFFVNPFAVSVHSAESSAPSSMLDQIKESGPAKINISKPINKKISLKMSTINNNQQKINDQLGNPIIIGIVVVWKVIDPTKAVFNVDNFTEYLSTQCDSALRNIVRLYPYDTFGDNNEKTLRASSQEISLKLKDEIQEKVEIAGLEIHEARITHLAYAPEIANAMLQRQQASAIIDARQIIVDGAVTMVEMALEKLGEKNLVALDEERKAAMVSNLMVVLCGNRDAQPIINSGSLY